MKLQSRNEDRSSDDSENNMFPQKKHAEQVKEKEKKQNAAAIKFNKKGNKRSQKAEAMETENSENIVEEEEIYYGENVYENIPSSKNKNKNKKKQLERAKVNEAVEKVLKQQNSDSSS